MTYVRPVVSTTVSFRSSVGWRVALSGDVYADAEETLWSLARSLCRGEGDAVEFDLSGITSMDVAGWAAVCSAASEVQQAGCSVGITNPSPAVRHLTDQVTFEHEMRAAEWPLFVPVA